MSRTNDRSSSGPTSVRRPGRVLPEYELPTSPICVVYPSRRHLSAKVRAFTEHLAHAFVRPGWSLDGAH